MAFAAPFRTLASSFCKKLNKTSFIILSWKSFEPVTLKIVT